MGTVVGSNGLSYENAVDYTNNVTVINDANLNDIQKQILLNKDEKVDKVANKGLSTNDYDAAAKAKVDAIPSNPKYTDTVYDDTALAGRVSTIEGKESGWDSKYSKPSGGIPKSDLASAVQTSLGKADTALQSAPTSVQRAVYLETWMSNKTGTYAGQYPMYAWWRLNNRLRLVCDGYPVETDIAEKDLDGNVITSTYAKKTDSLKNPNALTITLGSTTITYDGSSAQSITIPTYDGTVI